MDYKEYSRLRSIARKRIERASAAGVAEYIRIPTVAEVRASANPSEYLSKVRQFLNTPGATLTAARSDPFSFPKLEFAPIPPLTKLTPEQKAARRREQKRRSKAKRAVEKAASTPEKGRKYAGYLKALETLGKEWREKGVDIGNWLGVLSPSKARAFVDYVEYRFSQGDYTHVYSIDTFVRDFGKMLERNYNVSDITADFDVFLSKQKGLKKKKNDTNKYGLTREKAEKLWKKFMNRFED